MNANAIIDRLKEPSTWAGIAAIAAAAGVHLEPGVWQIISTAGVAIAGTVAMIRKEGDRG
ncbi:MAG: hypothetical protein H7841_08335 [Magnetospirillum sp. WYHS-4]